MRAIDIFSGAGGSSLGASQAGLEIIAAFDRCPLAAKTHKANFPGTKFFRGRLEHQNLKKLKRQLGPIDVILASPECTSHSPAKGNKPRCEKSKNTAFQIVRFARILRPRWIVVENVVSMRQWSRYPEFKNKLQEQGYRIREQVLNAMDFGVPQSRRRLFLTCDLKRMPPTVTVSKKQRPTARAILNMNGTYECKPLYKKGRARPTLLRARRALRALGKREPFLLVYYGSDAAGGWQKLDRPLRTITTLDRFALVKPQGKRGRVMRMLQVPELRAAMGMPREMKFEFGTRRDRIKLIGNAVCPPVMKHVVHVLTTHV